MLVVAGGPAHGGAVAAVRGVRPGAGRRCDRQRHPDGLRRVQQAPRTVAGRPLQALLGRGRRGRLVRGRRDAGGGAPFRRAAVGSPGARGGTRDGGQPGRRLQRADRSQRALPAAGGAHSAGQCRIERRRGRRRRRPRHRNDVGRSDRSPGAAGHLRPRPGRSLENRCGWARSSRTWVTPRPPQAWPA